MGNSTILFWGMIFSAFGLGYFIYGKKVGAIMPLVSGIALLIYPFFITNLYWLIGIGITLLVLPFIVRL